VGAAAAGDRVGASVPPFVCRGWVVDSAGELLFTPSEVAGAEVFSDMIFSVV
jgi:hypothetical protein